MTASLHTLTMPTRRLRRGSAALDRHDHVQIIRDVRRTLLRVYATDHHGTTHTLRRWGHVHVANTTDH